MLTCSRIISTLPPELGLTDATAKKGWRWCQAMWEWGPRDSRASIRWSIYTAMVSTQMPRNATQEFCNQTIIMQPLNGWEKHSACRDRNEMLLLYSANTRDSKHFQALMSSLANNSFPQEEYNFKIIHLWQLWVYPPGISLGHLGVVCCWIEEPRRKW